MICKPWDQFDKEGLSTLATQLWFLICNVLVNNPFWFYGDKLTLGCLRSWTEAIIYSLAVRLPARSLLLKRPHLLKCQVFAGTYHRLKRLAVGALLLHPTLGNWEASGPSLLKHGYWNQDPRSKFLLHYFLGL